MEPSIQPLDLHRMFLGDEPPLFLLEICVRTVVMYLYTLLVVRFLGKRAQGHLTPFELVIIIAMGSAVGDPLFYPEVPLAHGMVAVTVVVLLQRGLFLATEHHERLETFVESKATCVVKDGRVEIDSLEVEELSREELFTALRAAGIEQLGQVKRAYLETSGQVSVLRFERVRPGRPILPACDPLQPVLQPAGSAAASAGPHACWQCGQVVEIEGGARLPPCPSCRHGAWVPAVTEAA